MIKALSICFAILFAQLVALHWVDKRTSTTPNEARTVAAVVTTTNRENDDLEKVADGDEESSNS